MPKVGDKHFSYSKSGVKAAKSEAKKTGAKMHKGGMPKGQMHRTSYVKMKG